MRHGTEALRRSAALAVLAVVGGFLLSGCTPDIPGGRFQCEPHEADPCPRGYACKPFGAQHYCFDSWQATCANGVLEPGELCDSQQFAGATCQDYYPEEFPDPESTIAPQCTAGCQVSCGVCGDGVVDPGQGEQCDGVPPTGRTCLSSGFDRGRLECTSTCILDDTGCAFIGFKPEDTSTSVRIASLWAASADDVYMVGSGGSVLRFSEGEWHAMDSGTGADLEAVWGASPNLVLAGGFEGTVLRFDGVTWEPLANPYPLAVRGIWGSAPDDVLLVSSFNRILRFDGQQISNVPHEQNLPTDALRALWGSGPSDVIVVGTNGIIIRYDGEGWRTQPSSTDHNLRSVWGTGPANVLAAGDHGTILRYDGVQWKPEPSGTSSHLRRVFGTGPDNVFAAGDDGTLLHFDGRHWAQVATEGIEHLYALGASGPGHVLAAGNRGTALLSTGSFWRRLDSGTSMGFYGAWGDARAGLVLVGKGGQAIRHDGGVATALDTDASASLMAVSGTSARSLVAVGVNGTILRYRDGWSRMGSPSTEHLYGVWSEDPDSAWAVGNAGTILHFDGDRWSTVQDGKDYHLKAVWGRGEGTLFAAGSGGTLLRQNGALWEPMESPSDGSLRALWGSAPDDVFAAGDEGILLHFDGTAWTTMESPTRSHLAALFGTSHSDVFACGESGVLLHFDGTAWSPVRTGVGSGLQTMTGDARDLFIAGDQGILLHLRRNVAWSPTGPETACLDGADNDGDGWVDSCDADCAAVAIEHCSDGVDNDCDGLVDCADPDCRGARAEDCVSGQDDDCDGLADCADPDCSSHLACSGPCGWPFVKLSEVHGGQVDYIEIVHRGSCPFDLSGLGLSYRMDCDTNVRSAQLSGSQPIGPSGVVRLLGDVADLSAGERHIGTFLCDNPGGKGWIALCQGPCDLIGCSNVLDYFEKAGAYPPVEPPACATFSPSPFDVCSLTGQEDAAVSATRVAFDGSGPAALRSDWSLSPMTRDFGVLGACWPWEHLQCGDSITRSTLTARRTLERYGCFGFTETGAELVFRMDATTDTRVIASMTHLTADLDLVALGADPSGACQPEGRCLASSWNEGLADEQVEVTVSAGESLYLVVDGYADARSGFDLDIACETF